MRYLIIFLLLFSCSKKKTSKNQMVKNGTELIKIDSLKYNDATVVAKVSLIKFLGGDKYHYTKVKIVNILKNKSQIKINDTITVVNESWVKGITKPISLIYLKPHSNNKFFMIYK